MRPLASRGTELLATASSKGEGLWPYAAGPVDRGRALRLRAVSSVPTPSLATVSRCSMATCLPVVHHRVHDPLGINPQGRVLCVRMQRDQSLEDSPRMNDWMNERTRARALDLPQSRKFWSRSGRRWRGRCCSHGQRAPKRMSKHPSSVSP